MSGGAPRLPLWEFYYSGELQNASQHKAYCLACIAQLRPSGIPISVDHYMGIDVEAAKKEPWFTSACNELEAKDYGALRGARDPMISHLIGQCEKCSELNGVLQCEWSVESDGRRTGRALQLENASLRAEVAELRALVDALRAGALEELSYYATLQLPPYLDGGHAGPALQIDAHNEHGAPDVSFDMPLNVHLPGSTVDAGALCPTLEGQVSAAAVGFNTKAAHAGVQVNVFGTDAPPLYTGHPLPDGSHA